MELLIVEAVILLIVAVATLGWCLIHCTQVEIETLLGATVFGLVVLTVGFNCIRAMATLM